MPQPSSPWSIEIPEGCGQGAQVTPTPYASFAALTPQSPGGEGSSLVSSLPPTFPLPTFCIKLYFFFFWFFVFNDGGGRVPRARSSPLSLGF